MLFACGDMMSRLMDLALRQGIEADVARDIVLRNQLKAPPHAGPAWPWAIRIHALGGWQIERSDGPLATSRKESKRLIELLHLLVAQGNAALPQDQAADALWPDADGDAARNALDNAVHRLRKWLGGEDRIVLRHGALALNRERCWSDVQALETALDRIESGALEDAAAQVQEIRQLYRGALLPGDERAGIVTRRNALQRRVQAALAAGQSLPDR